MSAPGTPAPTSSPAASLSTETKVILSTLAGQLLTDVSGAGITLLKNAATSIAANPSVTNVLAQWAQLLVTAPLVLPTLESESIGQTANAVVEILALLPASIDVKL